MLEAHHIGTLKLLGKGPWKVTRSGDGPKGGTVGTLRRKGYVEKNADGLWELTQEGRSMLRALLEMEARHAAKK